MRRTLRPEPFWIIPECPKSIAYLKGLAARDIHASSTHESPGGGEFRARHISHSVRRKTRARREWVADQVFTKFQLVSVAAGPRIQWPKLYVDFGLSLEGLAYHRWDCRSARACRQSWSGYSILSLTIELGKLQQEYEMFVPRSAGAK
jgi:hypothetical protein